MRDYHNAPPPPHQLLLAGMASSSFAQTMSYPWGLIRNRLAVCLAPTLLTVPRSGLSLPGIHFFRTHDFSTDVLPEVSLPMMVHMYTCLQWCLKLGSSKFTAELACNTAVLESDRLMSSISGMQGQNMPQGNQLWREHDRGSSCACLSQGN